MSKMVKQPFAPGGKFVVGREFRFAGRDFKAGDEFPWRRLSCSVRRLRQLYEGRYLVNELYQEFSSAVSTGGGGSVDEAPCTEAFVFDPDIHEIVSPEKGVWFVAKDGSPILKLLPGEAKRLRKMLEPTEVDPDGILEE